jgi:protein PhnA
MRQAELRIPALAAKAGYEAYKMSLKLTGAAVVKTSRGQIVERHADGSSVVIKTVSRGKLVKPGTVLRRGK